MTCLMGSLGGRKLVVTMATMVMAFAFGAFCVHKGVELSDAGIFVGSASVAPLGYIGGNVWQKRLLGKGGGDDGR